MKGEQQNHRGPGREKAARYTNRRTIRLPLGFRITRSVFYGGLLLLLGFGGFLGLGGALLFWDHSRDLERLAAAEVELPAAARLETAAKEDPASFALPEAGGDAPAQEEPAPSYRGAEDPELRRILDAHVKAMGGWANWNRVESLRLTGTIERDGKLVDFCIIKKRPNQIRATLTLPLPGNEDEKVQIIRAHDGKQAWTATRLAGEQELRAEELDKAQADELLADAGVLPRLMHLWQSGVPLELLEPARLDDLAVDVIRARPEDGDATVTFFLSQKTGRVIRYETVTTADTVLTRLDAYRHEEDVLIPGTLTIRGSRTGLSVMNTASVVVGVGVHREYFHPADGALTAEL
jgi:hypothetical protein